VEDTFVIASGDCEAKDQYMPSEAQIAANRANAQKSTGPRSAEGKARSSSNARRHGLLGRDTVLPGEDATEFVNLARGFFEHYKPIGGVEVFLLQQAVSYAWRLRRFDQVEAGLFQQLEIFRIKGNQAVERLEAGRRLGPGARESREERPEKRRGELGSPEFRPGDSALGLGAAFRRETETIDSFSALARYDASLRRGLVRLMSELERVQDRRRRMSRADSHDRQPAVEEHIRGGSSLAL
jgi:hypothetical protein